VSITSRYVRRKSSSWQVMTLLLLVTLLVPMLTPFSSMHVRAQDSGHSAANVARGAAELLFEEEGIYGVVFMETDGTMLYKHNAELPFVAASLFKLIIMVDIFSRRERNELTFDDLVVLQTSDFPYFEDPDLNEDTYFASNTVGLQFTIGELMEAMISYSSNVAARAFIRMTNTINLNHIAHDMGMIDTHILLPMDEVTPWPPEGLAESNQTQTDEALEFVALAGQEGAVNITTPADIATFFLQLANRELISEAVSEEMEALLGRQQVNDRIPFLLPDETFCPHKTGNLINVVHDAGIVYGPNGPTIMVALTEQVEDEDRATAVIQRLALIAYGETELPPIPSSTPEA